jgi:indolepyruvate ferredoxin oxidoreductase beta subunit
MKKDIILAGVGGQGIISIASIIGYAALGQGMFLKQSEVHGMSQRGGDVMSNLRISHDHIASDLIPFGQADMIISIEPLESLRYLPYLCSEGWVITNTRPFNNIPNYPDIDKIMDEIAKVPYCTRRGSYCQRSRFDKGHQYCYPGGCCAFPGNGL